MDVTIDRHLYFGGSDIPTIMGINPFKSRFQLLLEKAQIKKDDFEGNEYTEYGNVIEPLIRAYINKTEESPFFEHKKIDGDLRYHADGLNETTVLEIKSTSYIKETVDEYKVYLVQLLLGMQINSKEKGKLAIYKRPKDFDAEFDEDKLTIYNIKIENYQDLLKEINDAIKLFKLDLIKIKANPFMTEEELNR